MSNQFKMCRVCMVHKGKTELESIFKKGRNTAMEIYLVSGIKILEFSKHKITALICSSCTSDLKRAIKFRSNCLESDEFFKKSLQAIETTIWGEKYKSLIAQEDPASVPINQKIIKMEPDDFGYATTFDDNHSEMPADDYEYVGKYEAEEPSSVIIEQKQPAEKKRRRARRKSVQSDAESDISWSRNEQGKVQCKVCPKVFTKPHSMKCHMRAVHRKIKEEEMHKCDECGKLFKLKYYLQKHLKRSHHRLKKRLMRAEGVERTVGENDEDDFFKEKPVGICCPFCNKYLTSRHSLKDHIRVKHEFSNFNDRFMCDYCGKDFTLKYYLLRHIKTAHLKMKIPRNMPVKKDTEKNSGPLPCSICGKLLKSKGNLSTHEKTHRILSPSEYYYCDLCGNKFKGRGEMTVHIKKRHLYKIRYPCEICGKSWRTHFQLKKHIKILHQKIREFKCEWCGKDFGEKNKLVAHSRIHTGEQPFQCKYCDRKFTHQTDMRRHQWGHTGRRPFKCSKDACGRGFMKRSELVSHESRCHHHINAPAYPEPTPNTVTIEYQYQMM